MRDAMDHGRAADRSAGDRAGRHVPLDGRRRAATLSAAARARDQRALFPEQLWRRVRRARERVPVHSLARVAGHGDAGRRAQRRHRHRRLRHCAAVACSCASAVATPEALRRSRRAGARTSQPRAQPPQHQRTLQQRHTLPRVSPVAAKSLVVTFLAVAALTGLSSFIYEIVWIRMLVLVLGASTHAFELMLAAFILGLAAGGAWIRNRIDRIGDARSFLGHVQVLMGARCDPDAAALRRAVRCVRVPDGGSCAHRSRLHAVPCRERRVRAGRDVAGNVPRRDDAAVDHASAAGRRRRRACDRTACTR